MVEKKEKIAPLDLVKIMDAKKLLENNSFAFKVGNFFGHSITAMGRVLPESVRKKSMEATIQALEKSWEYSLKTMSEPDQPPAPNHRHTAYALVSGAIGGVGVITLFIELPITTIIMVRSIADIARSFGENYHEIGTKYACLEVFAFGDDVLDEETGDVGYYATRAALTNSFEDSSIYIAQKGVAGMGAPLIAQIITKIAIHYQRVIAVALTTKLVPIVGAIMGASINYLFIEHFQEKAMGHFTIRQMERKYGFQAVKQAYGKLNI
ncbi:MAG: EcsC family protein [Spirochaetota bacterium]